MPIDPYSACPGGTGKKVKFCCSDLVQELDKVQRMLDGQQFSACLDNIRKLDEKYPGRACLQSIRVSLEDMVGDRDQAERTLAAFLKQHPDNAIAMAEKSLEVASHGDPLAGIDWLQRALEAAGQEVPSRVYDALGALALDLLTAGHFVPALAHLQMQVGMTQGRDRRPLSALLELQASPTIPVMLKDMPPLEIAPARVAWSSAFQKALEEAQRGQWNRAAEQFAALTKQAADSRELWRNLARLYSYIGQYSKAVEALRKVSALESPAAGPNDVPSDAAVDAEALAQLLAKEETQGQVDELSLTYTIADAESAQEKLAADRRFQRLPLDPRTWTEQNEPPPRAAFAILDRPAVASGKDILRDQVPNQLGQMLLFGKQTDRDARMILELYGPELSLGQKLLGEALGQPLIAPVEERVIGHLGQVEHALSWHWRLPDDTPDDLRLKLAIEQRRHLVLDRWPELPQPIFGGRTPQQAATEPRYRLALLAAIWLLELSDADSGPEVYNQLRRKLNLREQTEIDPAGMDVGRVPLGQIARLKVEPLTDEQLKMAFNRAAVATFLLALRRLAPEVVKRPSLPADEYKLSAYRFLIRFAANNTEALRLVDEARKLAEAIKQSSAAWDLMELGLRIQRGEETAIMQLIDHIQRQHGREPGVAQALMQLLMQTGLIAPDGRMAMGAGPAPVAAAASPLVVPGAAGEPGKLWTPDAPQAGGEKKSALWLPE